MKKTWHLVPILITFLLAMGWGATASASLLEFESSSPTNNASTRTAWLTAIGISSPEYLVDFESGFTDGQNVSGVTGLFPDGLVIRDTSSAAAAVVRSGDNVINGNDPVDVYALTQNEDPYLELDFSASPVDYVAFLDIDHTGVTGVVTFVGGGTVTLPTIDGAQAAEFYGLYRNDMPQIIKIQLNASGDGLWGVDNIEYGSLGGANVPLPAAVWLLGSGLIGLAGLKRKMRN